MKKVKALLVITWLLISFIGISQTTDGLVAYYPFNGNANDESDFNNHGNVVGAILVEDRFGNFEAAYSFNGLDDLISIQDNPNVSFTGDFTLIAWVYPTEYKSQSIIIKGPVVNGANAAPYGVSFSQNNFNSFRIRTDIETQTINNNYGYILNEWQMVTAIRSGDTMSLYLDDVLIEEKTVVGNMVNENASLHIGSRNQVSGNTFKGKIDDVRIYNRALDLFEIQGIIDETNTLNIIKGYVHFDVNENSCLNGGDPAPNIFVKNQYLQNITYASTNDDGYFIIYTNDLENETLVFQSSLPPFYSASPESITTQFSNYGNIETIDFCIIADEDFNDLRMVVVEEFPSIPGFEAIYRLFYINLGNTPISGEVTFEYDDTVQSFVSSFPVEDNITGNLITWSFGDILPFHSGYIDVTLQTFEPPIVEVGDELQLIAKVFPIEDDIDPDDNTYVFDQLVVGSYDPNDKNVMQGSEIFLDETGEYLDYVIRFQNIGNADAFNIRIEDMLSENLEWGSLRMLSASHNYRTEITNENEVSFIFENINLPPESSDPEGSQGFIAFQIKTNSDLNVGDSVENFANIYFDFNAAIVTNTVVTTVVENLGVSDVDLHNSVSLIPNPVSEILTISVSENISINKVTVYSMLGIKLIETSNNNLDFSNFQQGIYFVTIETGQGRVIKRIIKE